MEQESLGRKGGWGEKKGGKEGEERKGEGLFLWRSDEKGKGAGFELVKEIGMERKR